MHQTPAGVAKKLASARSEATPTAGCDVLPTFTCDLYASARLFWSRASSTCTCVAMGIVRGRLVPQTRVTVFIGKQLFAYVETISLRVHYLPVFYY